jgi:hypothetical protein
MNLGLDRPAAETAGADPSRTSQRVIDPTQVMAYNGLQPAPESPTDR